MFNRIKKKINILVVLPIIYLLLFEISIRALVFILTLNTQIFEYGFNKNIKLSLHSIRKGEFFISNENSYLYKKDYSKLNYSDKIWIFGGSTSNRGFCDSKEISWVDLLEIGLGKENFSRNGVNSNYSLRVLQNKLEKIDLPKGIVWANKVNEILFTKRSSNIRNKYFYYVYSIKKTLKNNSVLFYFFEEISVRLFDKIGVNIRSEKISLDIKDYELSAENYYMNTKKAIALAKLYNIDRFFIVSVFNSSNLKNFDTKFYNHYLYQVKRLIQEEDIVKFIDTKEYLSSKIKREKLFCDTMHQNYKGKLITAKIISNFINDNW
tara:strand:- start:1322 stop:2287 length:966 start_codon:yes stop_codon:yes gene_type:complete